MSASFYLKRFKMMLQISANNSNNRSKALHRGGPLHVLHAVGGPEIQGSG